MSVRRWSQRAAAVLGGLVGTLLLGGLLVMVWLRGRTQEEVTEDVSEEAVQEEVGEAPEGEEQPLGSILRFERKVERTLARQTVPVEPLRGPLRIRMGDVLWRDEAGRPFLRTERLAVTVDAGALRGGRFVASTATVVRPRVLLVRATETGPWNWEQMFDDGGRRGDNGRADNGGGTLALIRDADIQDGHVEVRLPAETWEFRDVDAALSRVLVPERAPPTTVVDITRLSTRVIRPDTAAPLDLVAESGTVRVVNGTFPFEADRVAIEGATFQGAAGVWDPAGPGLGLAATVERGDVRFAELSELFPGLPAEGRAGFALEVESTPAGGTLFRLTGLDFFSGETEVHGSLSGIWSEAGVALERLDLRLEPLDMAFLRPYVDSLPFLGTVRGTISGTPEDLAYDVLANLRGGRLAEPVNASLAGTLSLADGFALRSVQADLRDVPLAALRAFAPGLPVAGRVSGRISLTGPPGEGPLSLDVRLELATGVALVEGSLDLTGTAPSYDLSGRLIDVRLAELTDVRIPPVEFTGAFDLEGTGTDPATAIADVALSGRLSGWETTPGDSLLLRAHVEAGSVALDTLGAGAGPVDLSSEGQWDFTAPGGGALRYRLTIDDLEEVAPYLPALPDTAAEGSLVAEGTLTGTLDEPRLAGTLEAARLEMRAWAVESLDAEYDLVLARPLPVLRLDATAATIRTGAGTYTSADLHVDLTRPQFEVTFNAQRQGGGEIQLATDGTLRPEAKEAFVRTFAIDLRDQHWVLAQPAAIRWGGIDGVLVDSLVVRRRDGTGRVAIEGRIPPTGTSELDIAVDGLPAGEVLRLAGFDTDLAGPLSARLEVRGSRGEPVINGTFSVGAGEMRGVRLQAVDGTVSYAERRLRLDAEAVAFEGAGMLDIDATVPLALSFDPLGAEVLRNEPLTGSVRTEGFPVGALEGMVPRAERLAGTVDAAVRLAGTPAEPRLEGTAQLAGGEVTIIPLERRFTDVSATLTLEGDRVQIRSFEARSGGWARGSGALVLVDDEPRVDLRVEMESFQPIQFGDLDAVQTTGQITLSGPLSEPTVRGSVHIEDGSIELPTVGPAAAFEEELTRIQEREPVAVEAFPGMSPRAGFVGIRLDNVDIEVGENVWFSAQDARARLQGDLTVSGSPEGVQIVGTLAGERGTFVLRAGPVIRRFDIVRAQVRFFGSPQPNPALDITASRTVLVEDGRMEVLVRVSGTLDRPTISLATAGGETVAESQLLSFLIFGQPGVGLAGGTLPGEQILEQAFFGGLGDIAALQLEEAIVSELGVPFDVFQIRLGGPGDFGLGAPTVVIGKEIAEDVFLTVDAGVSSLFGEGETTASLWSVTLEWRIDREWSAELGIEPLNRGRLLRGGSLGSIVNPRQEFFAEIRRRWTY